MDPLSTFHFQLSTLKGPSPFTFYQRSAAKGQHFYHKNNWSTVQDPSTEVNSSRTIHTGQHFFHVPKRSTPSPAIGQHFLKILEGQRFWGVFEWSTLIGLVFSVLPEIRFASSGLRFSSQFSVHLSPFTINPLPHESKG